VNTINKDLFLRQISIEEDHGLDFFDSLLAASAENYNRSIISDDDAFDKLGIERIQLSR
jgi:predicted nucleic acid-binding protein